MNAPAHLSSDVLVDALYGIAANESEVNAHLAECAECSARWDGLKQARSMAIEPFDVSSDILAAQRRKIYERLERPTPKRARIRVPAFCAALVIGAGIFVQQTAHNEQPANDISDAQLFAEAYSMEESFEPSAAAPIQALFEEQN